MSSIVNAKLLADNLKRFNDLHNTDLSDDTIASAARDRTGDPSITADDVNSFRKLGNLGQKKMLVSAKQAKKLINFVQAKEDAAEVVDKAKKSSKETEKSGIDV